MPWPSECDLKSIKTKAGRNIRFFYYFSQSYILYSYRTQKIEVELSSLCGNYWFWLHLIGNEVAIRMIFFFHSDCDEMNRSKLIRNGRTALLFKKKKENVVQLLIHVTRSIDYEFSYVFWGLLLFQSWRVFKNIIFQVVAHSCWIVRFSKLSFKWNSGPFIDFIIVHPNRRVSTTLSHRNFIVWQL